MNALRVWLYLKKRVYRTCPWLLPESTLRNTSHLLGSVTDRQRRESIKTGQVSSTHTLFPRYPLSLTLSLSLEMEGTR